MSENKPWNPQFASEEPPVPPSRARLTSDDTLEVGKCRDTTAFIAFSEGYRDIAKKPLTGKKVTMLVGLGQDDVRWLIHALNAELDEPYDISEGASQ